MECVPHGSTSSHLQEHSLLASRNMAAGTPEQMRSAMADYVRAIHQAYLDAANPLPPADRGRLPLFTDRPLHRDRRGDPLPARSRDHGRTSRTHRSGSTDRGSRRGTDLDPSLLRPRRSTRTRAHSMRATHPNQRRYETPSEFAPCSTTCRFRPVVVLPPITRNTRAPVSRTRMRQRIVTSPLWRSTTGGR